MTAKKIAEELENGVDLVGKGAAFAAVRDDGSVVTWGSVDDGIRMQSKTMWPGFSAAVSGTATPSQQQKKTNSVEHVAAEDRAFAAAKDDGSFISWRRADSGGDSHTVQGQVTSGVRHIVGNWAACAAMKGDGSIVTYRLWKRFSPSVQAHFSFSP